MGCIFIRIGRIFEDHSGATIKKIFLDNGENTPCPEGAAKIIHYYVKFLMGIHDTPYEPCLILNNFSTHSMLKFNVNRT